mmetsp:Transcript_92432/g.266900  ORF Transcript_92432/g.266900 Transcript_92432/m.266900 type:complete len:222 (+) Transcript_92432:475-1140(+)
MGPRDTIGAIPCCVAMPRAEAVCARCTCQTAAVRAISSSSTSGSSAAMGTTAAGRKIGRVRVPRARTCSATLPMRRRARMRDLGIMQHVTSRCQSVASARLAGILGLQPANLQEVTLTRRRASRARRLQKRRRRALSSMRVPGDSPEPPSRATVVATPHQRLPTMTRTGGPSIRRSIRLFSGLARPPASLRRSLSTTCARPRPALRVGHRGRAATLPSPSG